MIDFILFIAVLMVFLAGIQIGAMFGGIPDAIRWLAGWIEEKVGKKK